MINIKHYLNNPDNCPFCDSSDITAGDADFSSINAWRNIKCNSCNKEWTEEFTITAIEEKA